MYYFFLSFFCMKVQFQMKSQSIYFHQLLQANMSLKLKKAFSKPVIINSSMNSPEEILLDVLSQTIPDVDLQVELTVHL